MPPPPPPSSASPAPASAGPSTPTRKASGDEKPELPWAFIDCSTDTLVILISHMLNLLIQHNDQVVLTPDALTRFHSRAPPGISVIEYLRRIVKYTNMEKIPLLSLLAYIDITCQHLPTFTLSSLTVHRFLIAGVCAGSKAQCDVFCTNGHYAKVGGIKVQELNSLERELLRVTQWALCCNADLLQRYYTSLIKSHGGYTQAAAPSTIPFRPFPRSSSKPRKSESPAPARAVSTPRTDPIEEDPAESGPSTAPIGAGANAGQGQGEDEEMEAEARLADDADTITDTVIVEAPEDEPAGPAGDGGEGDGPTEEMDVDPPDRPPASALQYSPHSDASSSIPSSNNSPRSSRSRRSRLTSLQHKQLREGQPASPRLERQTATGTGSGRATPDSGALRNGAVSRADAEYGRPIRGDEEMLVAPPPPQPASSSAPKAQAPTAPSHPPPHNTTSTLGPEGGQAHHHHLLHAPSSKVLKSFVGGIFHRKASPSGDHSAPHSATSSRESSRPPAGTSAPREPPLQNTNLHNGLEESVPPQPTHPAGEGEPWQPSSMIPPPLPSSSSSAAPDAEGPTSPRRTARIPRSPRVPPGPPGQSPRMTAGGGPRPDVPVAVTPKVRNRDERSVDALRSGPPPLNAGAAMGAVGGEESKRRAV